VPLFSASMGKPASVPVRLSSLFVTLRCKKGGLNFYRGVFCAMDIAA
jgi:hypothetical protein